jgi:1-acyl-sn-glycerol-3-phosphate acyltransferase
MALGERARAIAGPPLGACQNRRIVDRDLSPSDTVMTSELAVQEPGRGSADDLRGYLSGLEPDRRVTDWGRSERLEGLVDRTLYEFLYRCWFRAEVQGVENVPSDGGALLVASQGAAVWTGGPMIAKALQECSRQPRPVHLLIDAPLQAIPGLGMLCTKLGAIPNHPANVHRLLFDERQLVLAFPEPAQAAGNASPEHGGRRGREGEGASVIDAAARAGAPIVPVAVLGAEAASPLFAPIDRIRRLTRLPQVPLSSGLPLPAKFRIRFLAPLVTAELGWDASDGAAVQALEQDVRARIHANLIEMDAERRSVWLG